MAAGATISGQVRVIRESTLGKRVPVAGNFGSFEVDHKADPENSLYINPNPKGRLPLGAREVKAPGAIFEAGEVLELQHLSAALAEAADFDADEIFIGGIEEDLNTGDLRARTLTAVDTGLAADPTTSTTVWTTFFKYTVPDRRRFYLAGAFNVACVETA